MWFSFHRNDYHKLDPAFYDFRGFNQLKPILDNSRLIKQEVLSYVEQKNANLTPYFNSSLVEKPKSWKIGVFSMWGLKRHKEMAKTPLMSKVFGSMRDVISWSISILEPGAEILPHHGDSNGIIRCHFGVQIPVGLPVCGIKVGDELKEWESEGVIMFCDAHNHTAFNHSNQQRVIIIFDMINPIFRQHKTKIRANGLSILWSQIVLSKLKLNRVHWIIRGICRRLCLWSAYVYIPVHNRLKFI